MSQRQLVPVRLFAVSLLVVAEWSCRVHFCSSAHNIRRGGFSAFLANVQICSGPEFVCCNPVAFLRHLPQLTVCLTWRV